MGLCFNFLLLQEFKQWYMILLIVAMWLEVSFTRINKIQTPCITLTTSAELSMMVPWTQQHL